MLFAKLFGGRRQEEPDDPPSFPPVQPRVAAPVRPKVVVSPAAPAPEPKPAGPNLQVLDPPAGPAPGKDPTRGFDPYNSGVFNKSRAWERINRR